MWISTILILVSSSAFSQSKPLEKESLTSSEKVFDGILDKIVNCIEGGMSPYLSLLNDDDQHQWRAIGREGIRSYVERMRDFLKHRDESHYSDDESSEYDNSSDDSSEEISNFIEIPLTVSSIKSEYEEIFEASAPKLTSESVEIEKNKRK